MACSIYVFVYVQTEVLLNNGLYHYCMIIIKYGGSIINPDGRYSEAAMHKLQSLIKQHPTQLFCFIIGGGQVCRQVQDAASLILQGVLPAQQLESARDEIGIAITKINARFVLDHLQGIFGRQVCPNLVIDPEVRPPEGFRIYVATGALPGHSTDYDMMALALAFKADKAIKISDFSAVLDVPALAFKKELIEQYNPLPEMTWSKLYEIVGDTWVPGAHYPFDPVACAIGRKLAFRGFSLLIGSYDQLENMVAGKPFMGTLVKGR
jgi:uridylate kinase